MSSFYDVSVNINPKWFFVKFHFLDFWYTSFKTLQTRGKVSSHTIYNFCILLILNSYVTWAWQCNVSLLPSLFTACSLQSVSINRRRLVGILTSFFGSQLRLSLFCLFMFVLLFISVFVCFIIYICLFLFYYLYLSMFVLQMEMKVMIAKFIQHYRLHLDKSETFLSGLKATMFPLSDIKCTIAERAIS